MMAMWLVIKKDMVKYWPLMLVITLMSCVDVQLVWAFSPLLLSIKTKDLKENTFGTAYLMIPHAAQYEHRSMLLYCWLVPGWLIAATSVVTLLSSPLTQATLSIASLLPYFFAAVMINAVSMILLRGVDRFKAIKMSVPFVFVFFLVSLLFFPGNLTEVSNTLSAFFTETPMFSLFLMVSGIFMASSVVTIYSESSIPELKQSSDTHHVAQTPPIVNLKEYFRPSSLFAVALSGEEKHTNSQLVLCGAFLLGLLMIALLYWLSKGNEAVVVIMMFVGGFMSLFINLSIVMDAWSGRKKLLTLWPFLPFDSKAALSSAAGRHLMLKALIYNVILVGGLLGMTFILSLPAKSGLLLVMVILILLSTLPLLLAMTFAVSKIVDYSNASRLIFFISASIVTLIVLSVSLMMIKQGQGMLIGTTLLLSAMLGAYLCLTNKHWWGKKYLP